MKPLVFSMLALLASGPTSLTAAPAESVEISQVEEHNLVLYYRPTCPYCVRVIDYLKRHKEIKVQLKNISSDAKARKELIEIGGKQQVPCLFIDGVPLYESRDIIAWLSENYS